MSGFIRRYLSDPGQATILQIEGVVIIDNQPPGQVAGAGSGFVTLVAECEDGPFGIPTEASSGPDLLATFGGFGFTYDGVASNNPCARSRKADGALLPEYWNGNAFIATVNKRFARLAIVRVDTSVGSVTFTPLASVRGSGDFSWTLTSGQILALDIGGGSVSATFTGVAATKASSAGAYPTTFVGGETMKIVVDAGTDQQIGPFDVYFTAADQTQAQVVSRINQAAGYTAFSAGGADVTNAVGRVQGTSGNVQILSQDALIGTKVGFNTTVANGTGNVTDIRKVTFAEVKSITEAAVAGVKIDRDSNNLLRAVASSAASITVAVATTAANLGFTVGATDSNTVAVAGTIPAGTRVRNNSAAEWVTCQTIATVAGSVGPYSVKIRPAVDDGTSLTSVAGSVTTVPGAIPGDAWAVTNPLPIAAALTEAAIDAAYVTAIDSTLNPNAITRQCNIITAARSSNAVRQKIRSNALIASAKGLYGREGLIRPPLNTRRSIAKSSVSAPGVGATRDERVTYCYPGANTFVPQIAARGTSGGAGFTADGNIDCGFDMWMASTMSQLNPEENPGQLTGFMSLVNGLEVGNADVQNMDIDDYVAFKAAGICALRMSDGVAIAQSGVTSVDPLLQPALVAINRRRMADFIQDSLAQALKPYVKKKATKARRAEIYGICKAFLQQLIGTDQQNNQRIDSFAIDAKSGNSPSSLGAGIFRMIIPVRLLPDLLDIVLQTNIGENVDPSQSVTQLAA